jgi:hypothetical protein
MKGILLFNFSYVITIYHKKLHHTEIIRITIEKMMELVIKLSCFEVLP